MLIRQEEREVRETHSKPNTVVFGNVRLIWTKDKRAKDDINPSHTQIVI